MTIEQELKDRAPRGWKLIRFSPFDDERWSAVFSTPLKGENSIVAMIFKRSDGNDLAIAGMDMLIASVLDN